MSQIDVLMQRINVIQAAVARGHSNYPNAELGIIC